MIDLKTETLLTLRKFKIRPSKKRGQNFLIDGEIVRDIIATAEISPSDNILEIGPGIGTLTKALAQTKASVKAIELDKKLPAILEQRLQEFSNVKIILGDVLKINLLELMENKPFKVVANLPYYITTPILLTLLEEKLNVVSLTTMVQKEVAERMIAEPGSRTYGALSVAVQYYTEPEISFDVPPQSFIPAPAVTSSVVHCQIKTNPEKIFDTENQIACEEIFFKLVRASFSQRRKTLGNSLKTLQSDTNFLKNLAEESQIDFNRRAETLSQKEFARLAVTYQRLLSR